MPNPNAPGPDTATPLLDKLVPSKGIASAEIGEAVAAPPKKPRDAAKEGLVPVELLIAKHSGIDPFYVAYARGAGNWAQGKQLTEAQFLAAIEAAKGGQMHASLPPDLLKKKFPKKR